MDRGSSTKKVMDGWDGVDAQAGLQLAGSL
jgi:hypothetical protein